MEANDSELSKPICMTKVKNSNQTRVLVEDFTENNGVYTCDCLIASTGESFEKEVSNEQIEAHLGFMVDVTNQCDTQENEPVMWWEYFSELCISDKCSLFAEIINKREKRNIISEMPDVFNQLAAILNPFSNRKTA